ncbi:MAG: hypothetical protein EOP07_19670 [Proteobacteria bacterium]|nr:MAG: hypothetical protein EOP07_19670 [Pseudomonadota bacterium]
MKFISVAAMVLALGACSDAKNNSAQNADQKPIALNNDPVSQVPLPETTPTPVPLPEGDGAVELSTLTIDASDKVNFHYFTLEKGKLVEATLADEWIFAVRRYIFQTNTGSNGTFTGGGYLSPIAEYETFAACDAKKFNVDEVVTVLGYTISANQYLSQWYEYNDLGSIQPTQEFFAIGRDSDCLKLRVVSYAAGVYEIEYQQVK